MIARLVEIGDPPLANRLAGAAFDLTETAAGVGFRGPDPYDALWWPWPRPLVAGRRRRQALIQLHARSPIDVRRLATGADIRSFPRRSGSLARYACEPTGSPAGPARSRSAARPWICSPRTAVPGRGRGATPGTCRPAGASTPREARTSSSRRSQAAGCSRRPGRVPAPTSRPVLPRPPAGCSRSSGSSPEGYFAYHPGRPVNIHNASLLGAWLVHVVHGRGSRGRGTGRPSRRAGAGRAASRRLMALRGGSRPRRGATRFTPAMS